MSQKSSSPAPWNLMRILSELSEAVGDHSEQYEETAGYIMSLRDRIEALEARSVPEGLETSAEERASLARTEAGISLRPGDVPGTVLRLLRDHDRQAAEIARLTAALAAKDAEIAFERGKQQIIDQKYIDAVEALAAEKEKREAAEARLSEIMPPGSAWVSADEHTKLLQDWEGAEARAERAEAALWDILDHKHSPTIRKIARAVLSNNTGEAK